MEIKVLFLGVLAEVTQTMFRHYREISSLDDLLHRIYDEYPEIINYDYRIAVNNEISDEVTELKDQDEVSFLPPFAGG